MLTIILSVVFGLAIGYFAIQNTSPVTITFGDFLLENVPLYMVTIGALVLGVLIAWIFYAARMVSHLAVRGEGYETRWSRRTVTEMNQRIQALETENSRLRGELAAATKYAAPAAAVREPVHPDDENRRRINAI